MKKIIFIMGMVVLALSTNSCKSTQQVSTADNKVISGENIEPKAAVSTDRVLTEKFWKLLELYGNPITPGAKEAYIIFKIEGNQFNGNAGCNTLIGAYELKGHDRLSISPQVSTMMMCLDMETETNFLKVLETVDSYAVRNDTLSLHRARMAPLARFVAVYLR
jgi:heat shock protein HslJ